MELFTAMHSESECQPGSYSIMACVNHGLVDCKFNCKMLFIDEDYQLVLGYIFALLQPKTFTTT